MTGRTRVLQVINRFNDDAPAQSAALLAKYLDREKFDVTAISLRTGRSSMTVAELERAGIRHVSMEMGSFVDLAAVIRLTRFMRRARPHVVHSHAFRSDLWCGIAGRVAGVPLIVSTIRNHDTHVLRTEWSFPVGAVAARVSRFATSLADAVVAVSAGIADYAHRDAHVPAGKIHVIRNGFDFESLATHDSAGAAVRASLGWDAGEVVIGTLAALKPRKGLTFLVHAAREVVRSHPRARFFIAGDGPDKAALAREIEDLELGAHVRLLGHRDDSHEVLAASDVFVLPSLVEGLPRSLLEAMAMGKPVVVTDIGGSREVVRLDASGLIVPPADSAALAAAISRLAASADLRRQFGCAGKRDVAERFDARQTARAHESVYSLPPRRGRVQ